MGAAPPKAPGTPWMEQLGLLGWSSWSGHLTQSFFTHLRQELALPNSGAFGRDALRGPRSSSYRKAFFGVEMLPGKASVAVCQHRIFWATKIVLLQSTKILSVTTLSPALTASQFNPGLTSLWNYTAGKILVRKVSVFKLESLSCKFIFRPLNR